MLLASLFQRMAVFALPVADLWSRARAINENVAGKFGLKSKFKVEEKGDKAMTFKFVTAQELRERHQGEVKKLHDEGRLDKLYTEEEREANYRRGYTDGFITAVNAFYTLMAENGMTRAEAYDRCWKHWEQTLTAWECGDCSKVVFPPELR